MRHTITDLVQMQSLPLEDKVILTKNRIKAWYEHWDGDVYISFSGGKDSTVLKHIVDSMYSDVPAVFCNTGLEFPELRQFALKQPNVVRVDPEIKFYDVIERFGYPVVSKEISDCVEGAKRSLAKDPNSQSFRVQRINGTLKDKYGNKSQFCCEKWKKLMDAPFKCSGKCCDVMKKAPMKKYEKETGRHPMLGTMTEESRTREMAWLKTGCNAFEGSHPISKPMSFWTEQDVLKYIVQNKIEIAPPYGTIFEKADRTLGLSGEKRTGCLFCAFGVHLEPYPNRFQRLQKTHPKQWKYCIEKLKMGEVLDYLGVPYEDKQLNLF